MRRASHVAALAALILVLLTGCSENGEPLSPLPTTPPPAPITYSPEGRPSWCDDPGRLSEDLDPSGVEDALKSCDADPDHYDEGSALGTLCRRMSYNAMCDPLEGVYEESPWWSDGIF